jgi:hypothetical protein
MKTFASITKLTSHALLAWMLTAGLALAEKKYGPGATDTEIKIGQTMPYSGAVSVPSHLIGNALFPPNRERCCQ